MLRLRSVAPPPLRQSALLHARSGWLDPWLDLAAAPPVAATDAACFLSLRLGHSTQLSWSRRPQQRPPPRDLRRAGVALRFAVQQIGDSYVWGAAGPIRWDCSGLTMRSFQQAGVRLPHSSRAQYSYGRSITRSNLQPGDLVFFGSPISHVGIYIGKNKMVHAPRPGARVQIAEFGNYFGRKKYVGARRL